MDVVWWSLWLVAAYLAGSIPFALLLGRLKGVDIRQIGSGNVGATNLGRAVGKGWGLACFFLDMGKGLAPVLLAGLTLGWLGRLDLAAVEAAGWLAVSLAAMLGHVAPVWLGFRGGKGVATGLGAMLGIWPVITLPALAALLTWGVVLLLFRWVGLASVVAAAVLPIYVLVTVMFNEIDLARIWPMPGAAAAMAAMIIYRHRGNLARIAAGTEPKIGEKKAPSEAGEVGPPSRDPADEASSDAPGTPEGSETSAASAAPDAPPRG